MYDYCQHDKWRDETNRLWRGVGGKTFSLAGSVFWDGGEWGLCRCDGMRLSGEKLALDMDLTGKFCGLFSNVNNERGKGGDQCTCSWRGT